MLRIIINYLDLLSSNRRLNCNSAYLKIWQNEFIFNIDKISDSKHLNIRGIFCAISGYTVIYKNDNTTYIINMYQHNISHLFTRDIPLCVTSCCRKSKFIKKLCPILIILTLKLILGSIILLVYNIWLV